MTKEDIAKIAAAVVAALSKEIPLHQKEFLTLDEAAKYTGLTKSALYKLTHSRQVPYSKPNGKKCFFKRTELEAWMMSNPVATSAEIDARVQDYCRKHPIKDILRRSTP